MKIVFRWLVLSVLLTGMPNASHAQGLTASVGIAQGAGGTYVDRDAYVGSVALDMGRPLSPNLRLIGRASGAAALHNGSTLSCPVMPGGGCTPSEPDLLHFALAGGMAIDVEHVMLGVLMGPSLNALDIPTQRSTRMGYVLTGIIVAPATTKLSASIAYERMATEYRRNALKYSVVHLGLRLRL